MDIAKEISKSLSDRLVIAKVCRAFDLSTERHTEFCPGKWQFVGFREAAGGLV